jgi:hypothetical protein
MLLLFVLLFLLQETNSISINKSGYGYGMLHLGNVIRNKALKVLIQEWNYKRYKNQFIMVVKKSEDLYKTCFLNYCLRVCDYESLSDTDKTLIESIVSLVLY